MPQAIGRTDEGTPVSLCDLKGRAVAVFLTGETMDENTTTLFKSIATAIEDFSGMDYSPVVVSTQPEEVLAASRELHGLPFMMISDFSRDIHRKLGFGIQEEFAKVWIADDECEIVAVVPPMSSEEQVSATIEAITRVHGSSD